MVHNEFTMTSVDAWTSNDGGGWSAVRYSVVIPVYRSGAWLEELVARIHTTLVPMREPFEVVLVNDASPDDGTWPVIGRLAAQFPSVRGFDLLYNVGQFAATVCGLEQARGELLVTMDDDLQHPPEEIPKLITAIQQHPDILCVMGQHETKRHSPLRNAGSALYKRILDAVYGKSPALQMSSFRIMRRELAEALIRYRTARPLLGSMTVRLTRRMMNVPVVHHPRSHGRSGYTWPRLIGHVLDAVIYKSTLPLRVFSVLGFLTASLAFLIGVTVFLRWLAGEIATPGYTSLILTIAFFSGTILLGIGIVGEYVARIISEVSGPPRYEIRRITHAAGQAVTTSART